MLLLVEFTALSIFNLVFKHGLDPIFPRRPHKGDTDQIGGIFCSHHIHAIS